MQFHCYLEQYNKENMFIWKIGTFLQYYVIFVKVSKIVIPLQKINVHLFATKNNCKVCQVSLSFHI